MSQNEDAYLAREAIVHSAMIRAGICAVRGLEPSRAVREVLAQLDKKVEPHRPEEKKE